MTASAFWGGPLPALLAGAQPGTPLFEALLNCRAFGHPDRSLARYCGADFGAVRRDLGLTVAQMARKLDVPPVFVRGLEAGWRNPSTRQLLWCAHVLGVPFGAFFQGPDGHPRPHTQAYRAFQQANQDVLHL